MYSFISKQTPFKASPLSPFENAAAVIITHRSSLPIPLPPPFCPASTTTIGRRAQVEVASRRVRDHHPPLLQWPLVVCAGHMSDLAQTLVPYGSSAPGANFPDPTVGVTVLARSDRKYYSSSQG
ncbi:hypothetical protein ZHAS_00021227 [Anopheles sinensis]|uniref:Uncharacterized protein n=1 Tax=Anopheles sinensis TaxID=74873 RepID=A0A084WRV4_ANOSI|nr:hypothetical protein ZHAS_00021227 [Anopheles sinensis]